MHSVNFRYFKDMKAKLDEVSIGKPIIVIASFSEPFNKDNCSNHVKVIDSGNLGECFDEDFDLAEGTPLSVKQHFFTEAEKDDCDLTFIDEYAASIGDMVLEALGYGCSKGGVSNGD